MDVVENVKETFIMKERLMEEYESLKLLCNRIDTENEFLHENIANNNKMLAEEQREKDMYYKRTQEYYVQGIENTKKLVDLNIKNRSLRESLDEKNKTIKLLNHRINNMEDTRELELMKESDLTVDIDG